MKLNEALKLIGQSRGVAARQRLFLACGFEPLHLPAFLQAHYLQRFPAQTLEVRVGSFGDLRGNLERAAASGADLAAVAIEWHAVDSRLGLRSTASWSGAAAQRLTEDVASNLEQLSASILELSRRMPVAVAGPSQPWRLVGHTSSWQISSLELELELLESRFLHGLSQSSQVRVVHPFRLALESPVANRADAQFELGAGFPYSIEHASALGRALIELLCAAPAKKGLITDLDDTLWLGLVGEVGAEGVSWAQADGARAQLHGVYQSTLQQLHDAGVLLAVVSKNEPEVVRAALARKDLRLDAQALFPVSVGWGPKSAGVSSILQAWNIGADAVVVIDDSRMELEEIRSVHPEVTALEFSSREPKKTLELLTQLRDLFGKPSLTREDELRSASIRSRQSFEFERARQDPTEFLRSLSGKLSFVPRGADNAERLLSLINKTNQFNLNGERVDEAAWLRLGERSDVLTVGVRYEDRYGDLGIIGAIIATRSGQALRVESWVLSCRAFSRCIEDHMLRFLLQQAGDRTLELAYRNTPKNKPLRDFLQNTLGQELEDAAVLRLSARDLPDDSLPHQVL